MVERILDLMKDRGMNGVQLASEIGIQKSSISEWKKGSYKPSTEAVVKIADYFGVTADYVLGRSEQKKEAGNLQPAESNIYFPVGEYDKNLIRDAIRILGSAKSEIEGLKLLRESPEKLTHGAFWRILDHYYPDYTKMMPEVCHQLLGRLYHVDRLRERELIGSYAIVEKNDDIKAAALIDELSVALVKSEGEAVKS